MLITPRPPDAMLTEQPDTAGADGPDRRTREETTLVHETNGRRGRERQALAEMPPRPNPTAPGDPAADGAPGAAVARLQHGSPGPGDAAIALEAVTKGFGGAAVVEDVTFAVGRGEILGLIGPSGSGKTTTVRLVLGVHAPDRGRVLVLGREPRAFTAAIRERIGYLPQHFVLYPELTVRENLDFVASCYGVPLRGRGARLAEMLDFVELTDARGTLAGVVSGGMQRRLELACTLIHDPEVIVLDEPTAGIDPVLRQKFWEHFRALRDRGRTLLLTTQYVTEAEYCDAVAVLQEGRLVAAGAPDAVRRAALGGEVVELQAAGLTRQHLRTLADLPGVREVVATGPEALRITVEDARAAIPALTAALQAAGVTVDDVGEHHPNFDEVFVRLMAARAPGAGAPAPT
jgi:ABC-2 type transport system ATP-binding protein